jgi:sporulation protein YlmC with PRC-barrel domain
MSLQPLRDLATGEARGALDLRTWSVVGQDGSALGTVAEVIVDVDSLSPMYLQVVPRDHPDDSPSECWIRVPCRHVEIDEDERRVVMSDIALLGLGTATTALLIDRAR